MPADFLDMTGSYHCPMPTTTWNEYEERYHELQQREITCTDALERLLLDRSELDAEVWEDHARAYVAMTCHTDDEQAKQTYLAICRDVDPPVKQARFELDRKIADSPWSKGLDRSYDVLLRATHADVGLFHEKNPPLEAECSTHFQAWGEIQGAMSIEHEGKTLTMKQAQVLQESQDRTTRRSAWEKVAARQASERGRIDEIFDGMVALRSEIARNAGFESYRDYADVIVVIPCGFDLARTRSEMGPLLAQPGWSELSAVRRERVFLADGNQFFNRPGPRLVESLAILGEILHPEGPPPRYRGTAWELL